MTMKKSKKCFYCKEEMYGRTPRVKHPKTQKYCSKKCMNQDKTTGYAKCNVCEKTFKKRYKNEKQKTCSRKCWLEYVNLNKIDKKRECSFCHKIYERTDTSQKFCSPKCATESFKNYSNCKNCNKVFHVIVKGTVFCSRSCSGEYQKNKRIEKRNADCLVCGKNFNWIGDRKRVICSTTCEPKYQRIKSAARKKRQCLICNVTYSVLINGKIKDKKGKYCSDKCRSLREHVNYYTNKDHYLNLWRKLL